MGDLDVAAALARDEAAVHDGLLPWVEVARAAGEIRNDIPAARLCSWITVVLDGFLSRLADEQGFTVTADQDVLVDTVRRLLAP
ncbi:hypothetical protein DQ238_08095 [Geodermatophilus sp. TF02-6]|uniref:hypothetical protein n=1 Tax=Geodermatophilus sp. TF02-6 TaxID=2250575 RepID=UPI000DE96A61|nr:hypothetical protein [Geodermatophilus sp. TF02-6]RBY80539.1 hypothetical protein DQ238_08095 [Geodermatophilus sp. TF02-6]